MYTEQRPRIEVRSMEIQGHEYRYSVLLPSDYRTSGRRYPVLYWLHGLPGNHVAQFITPQTPHFFEELTAGQPVIVVFPEGGYVPLSRDWEGLPQHQYETFHMRLIEHIDATYRTHARRSQRAIAGLSFGGLGALSYPARHPELFSSAWTVSGLLDFSTRTMPPTEMLWLTPGAPAILLLCMGTPLPPDGHPLINPAAWDEHNPAALVDKLHGTQIYVENATGIPCDQEDVKGYSDTSRAQSSWADLKIVETARTFHREAQRVGLAHEYVENCGLHNWRSFERQIRGWFPRLMASFREGATPEREPANRRAASNRRAERRAMDLSVRPTRVRAGRVTTFRVRANSDGRPLAGVRVGLRGVEDRTNRDGKAAIRTRLDRPGRYAVTATKSGYRTATTNVRAAARG